MATLFRRHLTTRSLLMMVMAIVFLALPSFAGHNCQTDLYPQLSGRQCHPNVIVTCPRGLPGRVEFREETDTGPMFTVRDCAFHADTSATTNAWMCTSIGNTSHGGVATFSCDNAHDAIPPQHPISVVTDPAVSTTPTTPRPPNTGGGGGATRNPIDGECGEVRNTCDVGTVYREQLGDGTWEWRCRGQHGGDAPQCTAPRITTFWEIPAPDSVQSGITVVSGWACAAEEIAVRFNDADWLTVAYGTSRLDTAEQCGHAFTGFGMLWNWGNLGDGMHTICMRFDGGEPECRTVTVVTVGEAFAENLMGACTVPDFPDTGSRTFVEWQQPKQAFGVVAIEGPIDGP